MLTGQHFIAGKWVKSEDTFSSNPASGPSHSFYLARAADVETAVKAAEAAFELYGYSSRQDRAVFLNAIADEIEARGDSITEIGVQETGLPEARLQGERGRTVAQMRLFASHILSGEYLDHRFDGALADREPLPRPELHMVQRPIGPVAVFGASNFPLAFSTAGGDTAAALAAGCTVVVKGHPAHPGTGEVVAQAIDAAIQKCNMPAGVFSFIQGDGFAAGQALVQHPLIKAVGFTGSLAGGRALFDLCAARPEPIPFFGELGSVNPMFVMPEALKNRAEELGQGWASSLTMGVGQFCTNPGIAVMLDNADSKAMITAASAALSEVSAQTMLTDGIASAYRSGVAAIENADVTSVLRTADTEDRTARPNLFVVSGQAWLDNPTLHQEVFGPLGLVVLADSIEQMVELARHLEGQLTCTLHLDQGDYEVCQKLMPVLERKAGRVLANGFPTGVEVSDTMVHGGPYPASTNFGATSVGTLSIRRFLRPVCYQNIPIELLPRECSELSV
ncbi:aldehyde dehydrogenase (NADP(+)) [Marinomonas posidonica]|uniref:Aldehyde dehydrogenase (NADP(+)) n=1 Tax=Marinomonas posidonica (strain CECT 7376 / NCIMB 14433 / IVIA-Po-181) TaxID=491952 RepID=F6CT61_MARPP|nr:aldehyde dehydrogenase (NADP(+)) [Marinomonas posidonica]AEF56227.1 Aldehyde dehydrogenase (NADP(+)) [Marinomonas posidonica IVIA-Po-181]